MNRQLFLDVLLAARERLLLSYNCRELSEDAELNPCSIITQLESYLERRLSHWTQFTVFISAE
jgi:exonuclease V gamma subunit